MIIKEIIFFKHEVAVSKARIYSRRHKLIITTLEDKHTRCEVHLKDGSIVVSGKGLFIQITKNSLKRFRSDFFEVENTVEIKIYNYRKKAACFRPFLTKESYAKASMYLFKAVLFVDLHNFSALISRKYLFLVDCLADEKAVAKHNRLLKAYFSTFFRVVFSLQEPVSKNRFFRLLPLDFRFMALAICNAAVSRVYRVTLITLVNCIHIFGGRNYNLLKFRMDRVSYSSEIIILASVIFAFMFLVMYNIIGFYLLAVFCYILDMVFEVLISTLITLFSEDFSNLEKNTVKVLRTEKKNYIEYDVFEKKPGFFTVLAASINIVVFEKKISRSMLRDCILGNIYLM